MRKIISIGLAMLMMLVTAAMVVGSEDSAAKESMEKNLSATEKVTEEVKETAAKAEEKAEAVKENVAEAAEDAKEAAKETAEASEKAAPGFEALLAITGLLAVAFLVLGKKE